MTNDENSSCTASFITDLPWHGKAILLVDLDAFFASVEQLDHPAWRDKPVIVGGRADSGGVVATCSYEARAFGVRSAQAASLAEKLCPHAIWTSGHFDRYKEMSDQIMQILRDETPFVQQVSIDEAFLDVTPTRSNTEHPASIARRIQARVDKLGLSCSIGVGTSKSVAKIASEVDKPHGLTVVYPGCERAFLDPLPIKALSGVGPKAEATLKEYGIQTLGDLAKADLSILKAAFGKNGQVMKERALGLNDSEVEIETETKSISKETTFARPLKSESDIKAAIQTLADSVGRRARRKDLAGSTISLKIRFKNMETHTAQRKMQPTNNELQFAPILFELLGELWAEGSEVKLLGVGLSSFKGSLGAQASLFDSEDGGEDALRAAKSKNLLIATDALKDKFGENSVRFGHELRNAENTTGTTSKNPADYK